MVLFSKLVLKLDSKSYKFLHDINVCKFVKITKFANVNRAQTFVYLQYAIFWLQPIKYFQFPNINLMLLPVYTIKSPLKVTIRDSKLLELQPIPISDILASADIHYFQLLSVNRYLIFEKKMPIFTDIQYIGKLICHLQCLSPPSPFFP